MSEQDNSKTNTAVLYLNVELAGIRASKQREDVNTFIKTSTSIVVVNEYSENLSSIRDNRVALKKLLQNTNQYDMVIFPNLLCLGLDVEEVVINLYQFSQKINLHILRENIQGHRSEMNLLKALFQLRKERRSIRFSESCAVRKINGGCGNDGFSLGRPKLKIDETKLIDLYKAGNSYAKIVEMMNGNISKSSVCRFIATMRAKGRI